MSRKSSETIEAKDARIRRVAMVVGIPAIAALLVFANTLGAGFVYDDTQQIVENPWVQELEHLPRLVTEPVWAFRTTEASAYYRPVQMVSYNLLWAISGGRPFMFHLVQVGLHLLVTVSLVWLVLIAGGRSSTAFATGLLFAVHPIHTEVVAWVASLPELTFSLAYVAGVLLHLARRRREPAAGWLTYVVTGCCLLAALSKETGLTLPALLFLWELTAPVQTSRFLAALRRTAPYWGAAVLYLVLRWWMVGTAVQRDNGLGLLDALHTAPSLFLSYLSVLAWPLRLVAQRQVEPVDGSWFIIVPLVLALGVGMLAYRFIRRRDDLLLALLLSLVPLAPALYIPALGSTLMAERYAYLPSAGMIWLAALGAESVLRNLGGARVGVWGTVILAMIVAVPCANRSIDRNREWFDDYSLAVATLRDEPRAEHMYVLLAAWHESHGEVDQALAAYTRGIEAVPGSIPMRVNQIGLALQLGRIDPQRAVTELSGIPVPRDHPFEYFAVLGDAALAAQRYAEAEKAYASALKLNPLDAMLHNKLAVIFAATGRFEDAGQELRRALELDPELAVARDNLEALERRGSAP